MRFYQCLRPISRILILAMLHLCWLTSYGYAEMLPTESSLQSQVQDDRQRLLDLLDRQEVVDELEKYGISKVEAMARINSLTDEEVTEIAGKLDRLHAGGYDLLGAAAGAVIIVVYTLGVFFKGMVCIFTIFSDYCESKGGVGWVFAPPWWESKSAPIDEYQENRDKYKCYSGCYSKYYACLNPDQKNQLIESMCEEVAQTCVQRCEAKHAKIIKEEVEEFCDPGMESCL
jgi:Family of unknown function (DUF6627)